MNFEKGLMPPKESIKKKALNATRWAVLGAALLVGGCSSSQEENRPEKTETLKSFDFDNSFPVNKDNFNEAAERQIHQQVETFLDEYNDPEKFEKLAASRITIEVSSDERVTKTWKKGNEGLSAARLERLDTLLRKILNAYDFEDSLDEDKVNAFKQKTFIRRMPGGSWGVGFTPINRLVNPATNQFFTKGEIDKLPQAKREELYKKARYSIVKFEIPGKDEIETQYVKLAEIMANYDKVTLLLDRSASMDDDYFLLSKKIAQEFEKRTKDFENDTTFVVPFERNADLEKYNNIPASEVPQYLQNLRLGGGDERLFTSLNELLSKQLESPSKKEQSAIIVLTDEGIQDFDINLLREMNGSAAENKIDIYFALISENALITFVSREGLIYEYEQVKKNLQDPALYGSGTTAEEIDEFIKNNVKSVLLDKEGNIRFGVSGTSVTIVLRNIGSYYRKEHRAAGNDEVKSKEIETRHKETERKLKSVWFTR